MNKLRTTAFVVSLCALAGATYLVQKGDTLWDLSGQFLSNPFAWPDLWENNKHVQDPHWIYPGDSLCIPGSDSACAQNTSNTAAPVTSYPCPVGQVADDSLTPGIRPSCHPAADRNSAFKNQLAGLEQRAAKVATYDTTTFYVNKKATPKLFNMYYQRLAPIWQPAEDHQADSNWWPVSSGEKREPILHMLEHEIILGYGKKSQPKVKIDDLAEVWIVSKSEVKKPGENVTEKYALLRLAALARITAVGDSLCRASLVQVFRPLNLQQAKVRPLSQPATLEVRGYQPVSKVKLDDMGSVRLAMDAGLVIGLYSYVLIDKGTAEGFRAGSGVAFWEEDKADKSLPPRLLGKGIVARSGAHESAVLVREIYSNVRRLAEGHKVSLTHQPILK